MWQKILFKDDVSNYPIEKIVGEQVARDRPDNIMESNTDAEQWRFEVERVAPQLKVQAVSECCENRGKVLVKV